MNRNVDADLEAAAVEMQTACRRLRVAQKTTEPREKRREVKEALNDLDARLKPLRENLE